MILLRAKTRRPTAPLVLAAVGLLSHGLLGYVHLALVPHVRCGSETTRHLATGRAERHHGHSQAVSQVPAIGAQNDAEDPRGDLCSVCPTLSQAAAASPALHGQARAPCALADLAHDLIVVAHTPLFRMAPKQSPPV